MLNSTKQATHLNKGADAEGLAEHQLLEAGLKLVARNFRCRFGEIDLIFCDQKTLILVEVRYRNSHQFGGALASVTATKQQKIIKAAGYFLQANGQFKNHFLRFDVVGIDGEQNIEWIKGAFLAS